MKACAQTRKIYEALPSRTIKAFLSPTNSPSWCFSHTSRRPSKEQRRRWQLNLNLQALCPTELLLRYWLSTLGKLHSQTHGKCAVANLGLLGQLAVHTPVSHFLAVIQLWPGVGTCWPRMQSITRRLRELNVFSEMLPCTQKISELDFTPKGIILSGGPYSVYEAGSPHVDPAIFNLSMAFPQSWHSALY